MNYQLTFAFLLFLDFCHARTSFLTNAMSLILLLRWRIRRGAVYARNIGWLTYGHGGYGMMTSPGGAVEVGLIWNLTDPGAYAGPFMELAVGYWGTVSFSGVLSDAGREEEGPHGIKFGIGNPGGAIMYEQYI